MGANPKLKIIGAPATCPPPALESAKRGAFGASVLVSPIRRITPPAASAFAVACVAAIASRQWLSRATVFCCALAALWPAALSALRIFIVDWATFDADFLNSAWVAAIPAFAGAALITYYVPSRIAERVWTSWLLIVPVGGLVVLGYSLLQPWFLR